jgi:hypothetical protein
MSTGKHRQSHQTYRLRPHAAVISAVARADVRCARRRLHGGHPVIGAAPGCPATLGSGGAEAQGVGTR